jgi:hypothetical protein
MFSADEGKPLWLSRYRSIPMVPFSITIPQAGAPSDSVVFLFWGVGVFMLPITIIYTLAVSRFQGKGRSARRTLLSARAGATLLDVRYQASVRGNGRSQICRENSLLPTQNSLFFRKSSLIVCSGNLLKGRCRTVVSCLRTVALRPEIAIFPVKFPVCREFG